MPPCDAGRRATELEQLRRGAVAASEAVRAARGSRGSCAVAVLPMALRLKRRRPRGTLLSRVDCVDQPVTAV